jgi:hypothetical protein
VRWQHSERGDPAARRPAAPILAAGQAGTATRHTQRCRTPYGNCGNGSIILGRRLGGRGNVAETRFTKTEHTCGLWGNLVHSVLQRMHVR